MLRGLAMPTGPGSAVRVVTSTRRPVDEGPDIRCACGALVLRGRFAAGTEATLKCHDCKRFVRVRA